MFNTIYYWDSSSNRGMIEYDFEEEVTYPKIIEISKHVHELYKQGYLEETNIDAKTFDKLLEHLTLSAYRHYLINRKPYIILKMKYEKLTELELKCVFEYITTTDLYKDAVKHKDIILPVKLGWWNLKDIVQQYSNIIKLEMNDYSYITDEKW